ncbi:MAG: DUF4157 domain-containing protein [Cyanobacteria bacterium P01_G01_bin.54]
MTIGQPDDQSEQEADRVAQTVMQQINAPPADPAVQRELDPSLFTPFIQRQGAVAGGAAPDAVEDGINAARGGGKALDAGLQQSMGQAMGADFSNVKVHTDGRADSLNRSIQARAFTTGRDIFFRKGEYNPGSSGGQELIAHELTHTLQQGAAPVSAKAQRQMLDESEEDFAVQLGLGSSTTIQRAPGDKDSKEADEEDDDVDVLTWDDDDIPMSDIFNRPLIQKGGRDGILVSQSGIPYYGETNDIGDGRGYRYQPRFDHRYHYALKLDGSPVVSQIDFDGDGTPLVDLMGRPLIETLTGEYEDHAGTLYTNKPFEIGGDVDENDVKVPRYRPRMDAVGNLIDPWGDPITQQPPSAIGDLDDDQTGTRPAAAIPGANQGEKTKAEHARRTKLLREWQVLTLLENAEHASENFKDAIKDVVAQVDDHFGEHVCDHTEGFEYLRKGEQSAMDKAERVAGQWDQGVLMSLLDVLRTTIICDNHAVMQVALTKLEQVAAGTADMAIMPIGQNWFDNALEAHKKEAQKGDDADYSDIGYADIKQNLLVPFVVPEGDPPKNSYSGQIVAEVQVQHQGLLNVKEHGGGHAFYDLNRALNKKTGGVLGSASNVPESANRILEADVWEKVIKPSCTKNGVENIGDFMHKIRTLAQGRDVVFDKQECKALKTAGSKVYEEFWQNYQG